MTFVLCFSKSLVKKLIQNFSPKNLVTYVSYTLYAVLLFCRICFYWVLGMVFSQPSLYKVLKTVHLFSKYQIFLTLANVMITYIMPFFEQLNQNSIFEYCDNLPV